MSHPNTGIPSTYKIYMSKLNLLLFGRSEHGCAVFRIYIRSRTGQVVHHFLQVTGEPMLFARLVSQGSDGVIVILLFQW